MAKKPSLKTSLSNQQTRLKKKAKAKEAAEKQENVQRVKSKGKGKAPPIRTVVPFRPEDKILLIGEGNFSFSLALFKHPALQHLPPSNVTATSYDSESECIQKYPEAKVIIEALRSKGVEVLFNVDATALAKCKPLKGRRWDRIVWNFPHAGKGIADQDRNILCNQLLLLGFLASAASFLREGPVPSFVQRKKKRNDDSDSEDDSVQPNDTISEEDGDQIHYNTQLKSGRGTVLITLRNVHPYTDWKLPKLAKDPPDVQGLLKKEHRIYLQLRSFAFRRNDWPGYEHRMTKGERVHGTGTTGQGGEDRTWEFCLKTGAQELESPNAYHK